MDGSVFKGLKVRWMYCRIDVNRSVDAWMSALFMLNVRSYIVVMVSVPVLSLTNF